MAEQWKVIHQFSAGVEVQNPIPTYQNLAVSLRYEDNKLMRVEHELDCEDGLEPCQVINISRQRLELFWELLRYRRGILLPNICRVAQKVKTMNSSPVKNTGFADVAATVLICSSIIMPHPTLFSQAPARLLAWLRFANDASDSTDSVDAIRDYYMIWEDLHPVWKIQDGPAEATDLKLTRDFVSHGEKLRNKDVLDFVERNLGRRIEQFDPTDRDQQQFVSSQRKSAQNLIETELDRLL